MARWHILIVDDNPVIAEQTADLLGSDAESSGELVVEADFETSFDRALVLLEQQHYDLLVLDVRDQSRTGEPQPTLQTPALKSPTRTQACTSSTRSAGVDSCP